MDDNTIITFGMHKGKKLANVPAGYLLWLYNSGKAKGELKAYIEENKEVLEIELEKQEKI